MRCEVADDLIGSDYRFQVGKGVTVSDEGSDVGLVTTGFMLHTALAAADKLKALGIGVRVDHHPSLKPFDRELVYGLASNVETMVTLENHCTSGGLHSLVAEAIVARGIGKRVGAIGTDPDDFIHTGHVNDLLWRYRVSSDDVVAMSRDLLAAGS